MAAKSPRALVCMDFDGVLNSMSHADLSMDSDLAKMKVGDVASREGEDAIYVSGGPPPGSMGATRIYNVALLQNFFRILGDNDVLVAPGTQRFFMDPLFAQPARTALDKAFGPDRTFFTSAQIDSIGQAGLKRDATDKSALVRWMHQQYAKDVPLEQVFLVDDGDKYVTKTKTGYSCEGYTDPTGEKSARGIFADQLESYPKNAPTKYFWMADVLLQTVPRENLVKEIAQCDKQTREAFLELLDKRDPKIRQEIIAELLDNLIAQPYDVLLKQLANDKMLREDVLHDLQKERYPDLERDVQRQRIMNIAKPLAVIAAVSVATYFAVKSGGFLAIESSQLNLGLSAITPAVGVLLCIGIIAAVGKWNEARIEKARNNEALDVDNTMVQSESSAPTLGE